MKELFRDYPWEKLDDLGFSIFFGSAWVEVRVYPWGNDSIINTCSTVVIEAELKPDLLEFLLRSNAKVQFGGFSLDTEGNILFEHSIVGSTCDQNEFEESALAVLEVADDYDDRIFELWGGKLGLNILPQ
ncbi:MAG: YbjN domain-containing protein [Microcoleaceae cyanobacterium]